MLRQLLGRLLGGTRHAAAPAAEAAPNNRLPRAHAYLREGHVGAALRELAPVLAAAENTREVRALHTFATRYIAKLTGSEPWNKDIAYLFGAALLSLNDQDGAHACARAIWGAEDAAHGYRKFDRGSLFDHCRESRLPNTHFEEIMSWPLGTQGLVRAGGKSAWVCQLPGGMVLGNSFIPASEAGVTFTERCLDSEPKLGRFDGIEQIDLLRLVPVPDLDRLRETDHYPGRHVLIGNHVNFGHWLLYYFARLRLVREMPELADATLVVGHDLLPLHVEFLRRAGYPEKRILRLPKGRIARFEKLSVPSMICFIAQSGEWYCAPEAVHYLRHILGVSAPPGGGGRRLYLTRRNARWRRLLNEQEIVRELARLGFEEFDAGHLDLDQQMALAASARIIVAPFGAGLNLHLFAGEGVPVVQLQQEPTPRMNIHVALTKTLRQPLYQVVGEVSLHNQDALKSDFVVPPAKVLDAVARALAHDFEDAGRIPTGLS